MWKSQDLYLASNQSSVLVTPRKRQCESSITKPLMRLNGLCRHRIETPNTPITWKQYAPMIMAVLTITFNMQWHNAPMFQNYWCLKKKKKDPGYIKHFQINEMMLGLFIRMQDLVPLAWFYRAQKWHCLIQETICSSPCLVTYIIE